MKLSLNASTIKTTPLLKKIRVTAEAGFSGIELWSVELYEYVGRGGEIRDVEKALADHGLEVPCMIALRNWGETTGREYELALEEARRRMEMAARIGAPFIVCTPPVEYSDISRLHEGYGDLLQIGRECGVHALLEYISVFKSLTNVQDAVGVLDRCGDPQGALVIDAFHNWNDSTTMEDLRALPLERLAHYHINDANPTISGKQKDTDRVMPGEGPIDLAGELSILKEKGYDGWVSLELFNADLWAQDPLEVAKDGYQRIRDLVEA